MKNDLQKECERTRHELTMLYEIGNAMRTTLNLESILYIILTAVTSHVGLGFNRAMLFLVNEEENSLEGKMGIGPDNAEDADAVWKHIERHKMGIDQLIDPHSQIKHLKKSQLNKTVRSIKIPIKKESGILASTVLEGIPFIIEIEKTKNMIKSEVSQLLNLEEFVTVPLRARDKVIGVILADNRFTKKVITKDDIRILTMFANQAGLAIENSRLYEKTVIIANSDSLTGLWHHGYFQHLLGQEVERSKREKLSLSILMIDIDDFKRFNDTYGHPSGDSLLKKLANIFRETSRKIDVIARYGGEEFAIILPYTKKDEALVLAERLRKSIEENPHLKNMTISIGVAAFPEDGEDKEALIERADAALYSAKRSGKNKVRV